jgi:guanylate kinase
MGYEVPYHKYRPLVISGPSGVGKGTLIKRLLDTHPTMFSTVISHTTRDPRPGEDDSSYAFVSKREFQKLYRGGAFIEATVFDNHYYGTSMQAVSHVLCRDAIPLLDLDIKGVKAMKKVKRLGAKYVFIKPLSFSTLGSRLRSRGTEKEAHIQRRMTKAKLDQRYAEKRGVYDVIIINDNLETAYAELEEFALSNSLASAGEVKCKDSLLVCRSLFLFCSLLYLLAI